MRPSANISTFQDLMNVLKTHPAWMEELRHLILTDELFRLPQKFDDFVTKEFKPVKTDVEILKKDVDVLKKDVDVLKKDVDVLKKDVEILKKDVKILKDDVAELKGDNYERKVRERAPSYFGRLIKRCKLLHIEQLAENLENAADAGKISEEEVQDALKTDVVVTGLMKETQEKIALVAEVSYVVDIDDVERAFIRSVIIKKALGIKSIPVVVGNESTMGAKQRTEELNVLLVT